MTSDARLGLGGQAALAACLLLGAIISFHIYWALGGGWALHLIGHVSTPSATGARIFYGAIAILALVVAIEVLAAGRALPERSHVPVARRLIWALAAILALGGLVRIGPAPAVGAAALVLSFLFAAVAYATRPLHDPKESA